MTDITKNLKIGAYFVLPDGQVARKLEGNSRQDHYEVVTFSTAKASERVKGMIAIRHALRRLIEAEKKNDMTSLKLDELRNKLNLIYDQFVLDWGYISSKANKRLMRDDPEYALLSSLEVGYTQGISIEIAKKYHVKPQADHATKAAIFTKRVIAPEKKITKVETAIDALIVSENQTGKIDLDLMSRLYQKKIPEILEELGNLIYRNPETMQFERKEKYLSGNVKDKLRIAKLAAKNHPAFEKNVLALKDVQPADIEPIDIAIQFGSIWIPADVYKDFIRQLLGINPNYINLFYSSALGKWSAEILSRFIPSRTLLTTTYGTEDYHANKIIESLLEGRELRVTKKVGHDENKKPIFQLDIDATAQVKDKAEKIQQEFADWIWEDHDRRTRLTRIYNDTFNTHVATSYDGSHLQFPGLSLDVVLRPHQKNAIWRALQECNTLFDHSVGSGKTMICIVSAMESKRIGLLKKPMFVVPNHLLVQWKDEFFKLYPSANILVAGKKDFEKSAREKFFSRIATGDWDAVIVAHSSFKKIGLPFKSHKQILQEQLDDLTVELDNIKNIKGSGKAIKRLESQRSILKTKLLKMSDNQKKDRSVDFSDLGIDALFVDEFQEFKNLFIHTNMLNVAGLGNIKGSDKAYDMFVKIRHLQKQNGGKGLFTATGTPISNTIAEVFTLMRYHHYDLLKERNIIQFDAWAKTFGQVVTGWELDATGNNYRIHSRFNKFQNIPELVSLYRSFADVIRNTDLIRQTEESGSRFPIPKIKGNKPTNIIIPRSEAQARFIGEQDPHTLKWTEGSIIWRMENMPNDPSIDNPLKVTNEARLVALDQRLVIEKAEANSDFSWGLADPYLDNKNSKTNIVAKEIHRIYTQWNNEKGTQLVFCDLSTPKNFRNHNKFTIINENSEDDKKDISNDDLISFNSVFSVYDDLKSKLVRMGIPENEIRFIHEADSDIQKAELFEKMNQGEVRVLLGSTTKMGTGMNVQKKLVALHHIDAPWRPSDLEQREGRILRQGNELYEQNPEEFEVEIIRYATEKTYDARMWQTIENKAIGIEQFGKGNSSDRIIDDVSGEAANSAEMKAMATGNPLILKQVQLASELKKLETLKRGYDRSRHHLEERIAYLKKAKKRRNETIANLNKAISIRDSHITKDKVIFYNSYPYTLNEAEQFNKHLRQALSRYHLYIGSVSIGKYRGFDIRIKRFQQENGYQFSYDRCGKEIEPQNLVYKTDDNFSMLGFLQRLDNVFNAFEEDIDHAKTLCDNQLAELKKAKIEIIKPFAQLQYLEDLKIDNMQVLVELQKMRNDPKYVSTWVPLSDSIGNNYFLQSETAAQKALEETRSLLNRIMSGHI